MIPTYELATATETSTLVEKDIATRHVAVVRRLVDAAFDYLTFDDKLVLDAANTPVSTSTPGLTTETLIHATRQRDLIQSQIDQIEAAIGDVPEQLGAVMKVALLPPLRNQLEAVNDWVSQVQSALESQEMKQGKE